MKRLFDLVMMSAFLVATADLKAADTRNDPESANDGATPSSVAPVGPQQRAVADYGSPPPAEAFDAVPPAPSSPGPIPYGPNAPGPGSYGPGVNGPMAPVAGPASPTALPLPEAAPPMSGFPLAAGGPPLPLAPAPPLFPYVKYRDRRHIAPGAVPMYVAVRDPCDCPRHGRGDCGPPKCVLVEICVPPCGPSKISCKHDGTHVRYDYGRYAVNITSRHGVVVVNYDR
jgi:hypothetical protein